LPNSTFKSKQSIWFWVLEERLKLRVTKLFFANKRIWCFFAIGLKGFGDKARDCMSQSNLKKGLVHFKFANHIARPTNTDISVLLKKTPFFSWRKFANLYLNWWWHFQTYNPANFLSEKQNTIMFRQIWINHSPDKFDYDLHKLRYKLLKCHRQGLPIHNVLLLNA